MAAKMSKKERSENFFWQQKWTKNHPLAPVQSQIGPNLLKKQPPPPKKDRKFLYSWLGRSGRYKWFKCENDLMFCDTCLTAKACSNPFTEGCSIRQYCILTHIYFDAPFIFFKYMKLHYLIYNILALLR